MTSDDTKPTVLSAARLAEIRERVSYTVIAEGHNEAIADRAALLRYLDALAAGPVPDGEALGLRLYAEQVELPPTDRRVILAWGAVSEQTRASYRRCGTALYTHGFAAGAVAISGEGDDPSIAGAILILMQRRDREQREAHANGRAEGEAERARLADSLKTEHESAGVAIEGQAAEIARLQAELATEREAHRVASAALHDRTAELAEARATLAESEAHAGGMLTLCNVRTAERDTARRDGAREERRLSNAVLMMLRQHVNTRAGKRVLEQALLDADSRARGEGQGS